MRTSHLRRRGLPCLLAGILLPAGCAGARGATTPEPYTPGKSYYGRNGYVEYVAGNAPVILSAPHGGHLTPAEIPDRDAGSCGGSATTSRDLNTRELAMAMQRRYFARYGRYPHVVVNHLHRIKLDANRDLGEGACGDPEAQTAWNEFQGFLDVARSAVLAATGRGWYMDVHGHRHQVQRLELGYLLSGPQLDLYDAALDAAKAYEDTASIKTMSENDTQRSFSAVLRGPTSLGSLYASNGFPSVPSSGDPGPRGAPYFSGGHNTRRHACGVEAAPLGGTAGGNVCGVQIEAYYTGVRDTQANMDRFGDVTAAILDTYLTAHWGLDLDVAATPARSGRRPPRR